MTLKSKIRSLNQAAHKEYYKKMANFALKFLSQPYLTDYFLFASMKIVFMPHYH